MDMPKGSGCCEHRAVHEDDALFPDAASVRPATVPRTRKPDIYDWIPFGGGTRRCIGAAFANMEMDVVLRTLLDTFELMTTTAPDERWHNRGVANAPAKGGLAVVRRHRRSQDAEIAA